MRKILLTACILGTALMAQPPTSGGGAPGGQSGGQSPTTPPTLPESSAGSATTPGATADTAPRKMDDKKFAKDAALGGMTEVELGKLAAQKASNDAVKQFGQRMVDDHSKANDQLKQIASKSNIEVPAALDSKHQSHIDKLSKLSGPAFDKAYVKDMLKDHQHDVDDFKSEAQNGSDPNIKQFAMQTLPTLQEHLNAVKDLKKTVK
jgi:putative membrane protein